MKTYKLEIDNLNLKLMIDSIDSSSSLYDRLNKTQNDISFHTEKVYRHKCVLNLNGTEIEELLDGLSNTLAAKGIDVDSGEINSLGLRIETLIDIVSAKYF